MTLNLISIKLTKIVSGVLLIGAVTLGITSCSSREEKGEDFKNADTILKFSIVGIEETGNITPPIANAITNTQGNSYFSSITPLAEEKIANLGNFDMLTSVDVKGSKSKAAASLTDNKTSIAATSPMSTTVKYRIIIYKAGTNTIVADVVGTPGTDPSIAVSSGQAYDWYAYSTNETTVPAMDSNGNILKGGLTNKDLLYARSLTPITPNIGQNNLNIVFQHKTVKLNVQLSARGVFGKISNTTAIEIGQDTGSGFTSIAQVGDFNILTNSYSNLSGIPPIIGTQMVNASVGGDPEATKTATFYSATPVNIPANSLRLRLNTMDVTIDDGTTRNYATNKLVPYTHAVPITTIFGNEYNITAQMIESGIVVGATTWARTNLYYAENSVDRYRFLPTNDLKMGSILNLLNLIQLGAGGSQVKAGNLYWNWNSLTPEGTPGSGDPCAQVYPSGKWKTPNQAQLSALGTVPSDGMYYDTPLLGTAHFAAKWTAPSPVNITYPLHSQQLFLPMYGFRSGGQIYYNAGSLLAGVAGSAASNYWSSNGDALNGVGQTRSFTAVLSALSALIPPIITLDTGFVIGPVSTTDRGMSVRCVRS
ncbi:hypothetical protein HZP44_14905 [Elizabethkingia anophelis]|nr:hypothetical protein [Elizabethkingia anophelis]MCT4209648.1 hypothetical protein [Elizabethkingia anophelis]